jgi:glycosyltransferase involved in cell wall biosynthesis
MSTIDATVFTCGWYHAGIRDYHLAMLREHAHRAPVSIVRITDGRDAAMIKAENARFGAARTYVFRSRGPILRNLAKLLPIFPLFVLMVMLREGRRGQFITHDGFCFWSVPSIFLRNAQLFAHDPKPHESAERPAAASFRRRYFRFVYFVKRWKSIVVGAEANRAVMLAGGCASPVAVSPFPHFDSSLFEGVAQIPELEGARGYILFFGRVDIYKGVYDWLVANPDLIAARKVVIAGELIDTRVTEFADRITLIGRFIKPEEVPHLFQGAAALICPYLSATHSGIPDLGISFGAPVYVSSIPYFDERYAGVAGVSAMDALASDLAARP